MKKTITAIVLMTIDFVFVFLQV